MQLAIVVQIVAACIGIIGSAFFAIGIIRQSAEAMAKLTGTYWGHNPHLISALATQKAEYVFGGFLILIAFTLQLLSFLAPPTAVVGGANLATLFPWLSLPATAAVFVILKSLSNQLAHAYEAQIDLAIKAKEAKHQAESGASSGS